MTSGSPGDGSTPRRIVLIRHGQTEWSANGRHTSVTELDLTAEGERQATRIPSVLTTLGLRPTVVLSSPRLRALRTAELAGLTVDRVLEDLAEWNYGDYEGITSSQIHRERPGWSVFSDGAPGGEAPDQVGARADRALAAAQSTGSGDGSSSGDGPGDVVLVGHGHFSRVLAARWAGLPVTAGALLIIDAGSVSVLGHYHGAPALQHLNVPAGPPDA